MASNGDTENPVDIPPTDQTERNPEDIPPTDQTERKSVIEIHEDTEMANYEAIQALNIINRLLSSVMSSLIIALLIVFVYAFCQDMALAHQDGYSSITKGGLCSVQIKGSDIVDFEKLVVDKNMEAVYVNLHSILKVETIKNTDIYLPREWIWTYDDSPILGWPESYNLWSFGILDLHTERDVDMNLEINSTHSGCTFTWGEYSSTLAVGNALMNMTKGLFDKKNKLKQSRWCYRLKERDIKNYPVFEQDFSFFIQDVSFKCCTFKRIESGNLVTDCSNSVKIDWLWTVPPFILSFIMLLLSPYLIVTVSQYLSFESHVHWVTHKHQTSDFDLSHPDTDSAWVFADYKSPVTFFSFLRCFMVRCEKDACTIFRNILLALLIVAGSLSVIFLSLVMYTLSPSSYKQVEQEIKNGIPVGFLSLLFPDDNKYNFMHHLSGPYVFLGLYISFAVVYFFFLHCIIDFKNVKTDTYDIGSFTLNLDLVKKYGGMGSGFNSKYELIETIHANSRAVLRPRFWCDIGNRLLFGDEKVHCKCCSECKECEEKTLYVLKVVLLPMSCLFSICIHFIPFLFANYLILKDCIMQRISGSKPAEGKCCTCLRICICFFSMILHSVVCAALIFIFIGSAEFIMFLFSFCILSVVLYPGTASGIFIFVFSGAYFVVERIRSIGRNYATYRDLVILISHELSDKCKGAEAICSNDRKNLVIAGVRKCDVKKIEIFFKKGNRMGQQTENERNNLSFHCHLVKNTLKIFDVETSCLEKVSMNGLDVAVPKDQSKLILVVESDGSDRRLVLMDADSDTMNPDEGVCYVMYRHGFKGIPQGLLDKVIQKHMPVGAERIRALVWIALLIISLVWTHLIIRRITEWEQMTTITQALISLVIVHLFKVIREFSLDVNEKERKNILKGKLRLTILEYWEIDDEKENKRKKKFFNCCCKETPSDQAGGAVSP